MPRLRAGEWLQTSAGTYVQVTAIERWTVQNTTVNNLTISDVHTYYVVAAATPILVHNTSGQACEAWTASQGHVTAGVLDVQVDQVPLGSGPDSGGFLSADRNAADGVDSIVDWRSVPGMTDENRHHVEMQAAAYMRLNNIQLGRLYINHPDGVCGYCDGRWYQGGVNIEDALPEGAQLWISVAGRTTRYVGNRR
ncbi:DddA-like double-stranded DNA deaminase toxin [Streptomyces sp. NPDC101234]|uniref:DddA-like double-stranded DNA deaminase toxin n=1 Tax=Streptomyces sp. NPDC101234 TaxID=3366138 RepID=UPI0037F9D91A